MCWIRSMVNSDFDMNTSAHTVSFNGELESVVDDKVSTIFTSDEPDFVPSTEAVTKELSDMVNYFAACKFKGFDVANKERKQNGKNSPPILRIDTIPQPVEAVMKISPAQPDESMRFRVYSLNEAKAKIMARSYYKNTATLTTDCFVRVYPAGKRVSSSNYNPIEFWTCGMQMVALNYQTNDVFLRLNEAMFGKTGNSGYIPKPEIIREKESEDFCNFNSDFFTSKSVTWTIEIISGQYLTPGKESPGSLVVELELFGIAADCKKEMTSSVALNGLNPAWNQSFTFKVLVLTKSNIAQKYVFWF